MCGIVGFKSTNNYQKEKKSLPKAADYLMHRGPDDLSLFFDEGEGVGFAHRRLSIIDLSIAGRLPMGSEDRRIWISCNGEIYNFINLCTTLQELGYKFRSTTDTEVIVQAYREWGINCLKNSPACLPL